MIFKLNELSAIIGGLLAGTGAGGLTPEQEATLLYFKYNPNTDKLEAAKSIETILASIFLGQQHKVTSGTQNVFVKNLTSDINYSPAWSGIKDQSNPANQGASGLLPLVDRIHVPNLGQAEPDGPISVSDITGYQGDATFTDNTTLFGVQFRLGQSLAVGNILRYSLFLGTDDTGIKVYEQSQVVESAFASGDFYDFWYDSPSTVFGGTTLYAEITVESAQNVGDETILQVYAAASDPSTRYTLVQIREFTDLEVINIQDYKQRQLIRPGLKSDISVAAATANLQIRITADDGSGFFEVYFNNNLDADNRDGFSILAEDSFQTPPLDPAAKSFHVSVDNIGAYHTTETKTSVEDLTRVHLCTYTAINGEVIPESIVTNPWLSWADKGHQGVLEADGVRADSFKLESRQNADLSLQSEAYSLIANSINYAFSKLSPHRRDLPAEDPFTWTYLYSGITAPPAVGTETLLDPTQWDNGGTLDSVPGGQASVQLVLITLAGQPIIVYGQQLFSNYDDAIINAQLVEFELPPGLFDAVEVARVVMKGNASQSEDVDEVSIIPTAGGAGGSGPTPDTTTFFDGDFELKNSVDDTKRARFDASEVPPGTTKVYKLPGAGGTLALVPDNPDVNYSYIKFNPNKLTNGEAAYRNPGVGMRCFRTGVGTWSIENDGTVLNALPSNWAVRAASGSKAYIQVHAMIAGIAGYTIKIESWGSGNGPNTGQPGTLTLKIRDAAGAPIDVTNANGHVYIAYREIN